MSGSRGRRHRERRILSQGLKAWSLTVLRINPANAAKASSPSGNSALLPATGGGGWFEPHQPSGKGRAEGGWAGRVGDVPQLDSARGSGSAAAVATAGQDAPVGAERRRAEPGRARAGGDVRAWPGGVGRVGDVPQADIAGAVEEASAGKGGALVAAVAAGGQGAPVGAERHRADRMADGNRRAERGGGRRGGGNPPPGIARAGR